MIKINKQYVDYVLSLVHKSSLVCKDNHSIHLLKDRVDRGTLSVQLKAKQVSIWTIETYQVCFWI